MMLKPTVLLITANFPPEKSGGVGRPYSVYKYLPENGITPVVVTIGMANATEQENVYRFDSMRDWRSNGIWNNKIFYRMIMEVLRIFGLGHYDVLFTNNVLKSIKDIIDKYQIKAIYATFPPLDTLIIAQMVSKRYGLPIISEFRDGYAFESIISMNGFKRFFARIIEKYVVNNSAAIITIGNNLTSYFRNRYKDANVFTVFNGFDCDDFSTLDLIVKNNTNNNKIMVANFGSLGLTKKRSIVPLLVALKQLKENAVIAEDTFELSLIGRYTADEIDLVGRHNLSELIKFYPQMNKTDGFLKIKKDYDFLLFYGVEGESTVISSKIYEYMKLSKPIIGICKGNEAEQIIKSTGTGEVCDFNSDSIYELFYRVIHNKLELDPDPMAISIFDRRIQAERIADILKTIVNTDNLRIDRL